MPSFYPETHVITDDKNNKRIRCQGNRTATEQLQNMTMGDEKYKLAAFPRTEVCRQ